MRKVYVPRAGDGVAEAQLVPTVTLAELRSRVKPDHRYFDLSGEKVRCTFLDGVLHAVEG